MKYSLPMDRSLGVAAIVTMAVLLLAVLPIGLVGAVTVPTEAQLNGPGGIGPAIKCKWEMPDDRLGTPCTQVEPVPGPPAGPDVKIVEIYAVVQNVADDGHALSWVFARVLNPDGTLKVQVENFVKQTKDVPLFTTWIEERVLEGCITRAEADDAKYELGKCTADLWKGSFEMTSHQVAGTYKVEVYAVDGAGDINMKWNPLEYLSIKVLYIDFTKVNFGTIVPCVEKPVTGDEDLLTPDKPSVKNCGNDPFKISVNFSDMTGQSLGKDITDFDAIFESQKLILKGGIAQTFSTPLQPCNTKQIDFSVHAVLGTPEDTYKGTLELLAV